MKLDPNLDNYKTFGQRAFEAEIDIKLSVMVIKEKDVYECYIRSENEPYKFMFGLPASQDFARHDALKIAIANAPSYLDLFDDE